MLRAHGQLAPAEAAFTVLAPHADDAALSLAGTLAQLRRAGASLTVVTCHTRSAWAPQRSPRCAVATVTRMRRQEDARYAALAGARLVELDFAEAALRRPGLAVQRPLDAGDRAHGRELRRALAPHTTSADRAAWLLVPLAIGDHVDHGLVQAAAVRAQRRPRIVFYEDLPYALWSDWMAVRARVRVAERLSGRRLRPLRLARSFVRARARALACYPSQMSVHQQRTIERAVRVRGGEILWAPSSLHAPLQRLAGTGVR